MIGGHTGTRHQERDRQRLGQLEFGYLLACQAAARAARAQAGRRVLLGAGAMVALILVIFVG
jgi:hypothetical protein